VLTRRIFVGVNWRRMVVLRRFFDFPIVAKFILEVKSHTASKEIYNRQKSSCKTQSNRFKIKLHNSKTTINSPSFFILFSLAKNYAIVFSIGFFPMIFLFMLGIEPLLVFLFSTSLMLIWSDGFLTYHSLKKGAIELNPIMNWLNKKIGRKWCVYLSRLCGSLFSVIALAMKNLYLILVIVWLFASIVCLSAVALALAVCFDDNENIKDSNYSQNK
jgi:hypothetical protein